MSRSEGFDNLSSEAYIEGACFINALELRYSEVEGTGKSSSYRRIWIIHGDAAGEREIH